MDEITLKEILIVSGGPRGPRWTKNIREGLKTVTTPNHFYISVSPPCLPPGVCVVLDLEEIDELCGGMTTDQLHQRITYFRGKLFDDSPNHKADRDQTRVWSIYFIEKNHIFGIVYAWATACTINKQ